MQFYSTHNVNKLFSFRQAVLQGLPQDGGLFMPASFPALSDEAINSLDDLSISEIGYEIIRHYAADEITSEKLKNICNEAFDFPIPLVKINDELVIAELFHGPTMAFKDFGARFMARMMSALNQDSGTLTILVATSGDTGGAVADGFFGVSGIEVIILYPSGGVSEIQEKQLTTYGGNIMAFEVKGTFDDCQRLVKAALIDKDLAEKFRFSSANSINIARLLPQMIYYFYSFAKLKKENKNICFAVPSGNFGNLTAGLFAMKMGLPVKNFIAATNINDIVPQYLQGKGFNPRTSMATLSNAMDVGNPSNFGRMLDIFNASLEEMQDHITAVSVTDNETQETIEKYQALGYSLDPHGAVGVQACEKMKDKFPGFLNVVLETAHPAKFNKSKSIDLDNLPGQLKQLMNKPKRSIVVENELPLFKAELLKLK